MKKNKKIIIFFVLAMLITGGVSGCGDKKNKKETNATATDAVSAEHTTESSGEGGTSGKTMDDDGFYAINDYVKPSGDIANIMIKPSMDSGIYRYLQAGEALNRTGYNDTWSRVVVDNTDFYILTEALQKAERPGNDDTSEEDETEALPKVVAIDPGNQANENVISEPIGPNSQVTKRSATKGNVGSTYDTNEYEINLVYAMLLKTELENRGYEVVLTRDSNDADISNKQRAELANSSGASVFIRIQMNYSSNKELSGTMAITMTGDSPYNSRLYGESYHLATRILQGIVLETGAVNQGIYETNDMTAINWSEIPVVVIKVGFLSNANDEANLLDVEYQTKMISGIANGVDSYFAN